MFFSAFLAEVAGVEGIIGAFVAGLVLNKLVPHNSILMNRIDFIGNSLFIPFFLIFVGMVVDYRAFFAGSWPLIIAAVLTTFAIFSKWLAAYTTQIIFKLSKNERNIIFGLSTSHAAATLAIIMVGYGDGHGILDINIVNGTILLILFTCMTASFVTESAGKNLLIEQAENGDEGQNETKLRNQHVLVSMNELQGNESLLDFGILISDSKVINPISVVSVHENNVDAEKMIRKSRKSLEDIVKHFSGHEIKINTIATIDLNISSGIARVSKELVSDIVILNDSSKINLLKRLVGDDRSHLLDSCDKTIFFCRLDQPSINYERIVLICPAFAELETDFAIWMERILRLAKELSIKVHLYGTEGVYDRALKVGQANKIDFEMSAFEIDTLDDVFLKANKKPGDIVVVCASRFGSVSYTPEIEGFLTRVEKAYPDNDTIIIYPGQEKENIFTNYDDITGNPISVGVETIQKIGKEVGSIFKKNTDTE